MQEGNLKCRGQRRPEQAIDLSLMNIWLTEVTDPGVSPSLLWMKRLSCLSASRSLPFSFLFKTRCLVFHTLLCA